MRNRVFSILKYLLGWPFSILAFIFILRLIAPKIPEFMTRIQQLNAPLLFFGIIFFLIFYAIRSYIWHRLLKQFTKKIAFKNSAYFWAISELKRYIPGSIWSFLGRAFAFSELGVGKKDVAKLIIVEAGLLVLGSLVISLLSLPFITTHFLPGLNSSYYNLVYFTTLILVTIYIFNQKFIKFMPDFGADENSLLLLLSSCAVFAFGVANYLVISSIVYLRIDLFLLFSGFFALSLLLGYLSLLTPAGFGVREGIVIAGLSKFISLQTSAFAALFSRVILIFSELIFILLTFIWHKSHNKKIALIENWISRHKQETALGMLGMSFTVYFSIVSFLRYDNFYTGKFDLGNMVQTVWNTTQGRIFEFTNPNATENVSRLAFHADFLLILLAPIYAIFSTPKTLLFIQVAVVALGSAFIYLIAKDKLQNKNLALAFGFAYLINPSIQRTILYDFHPVTLATTFLLGTYYFYNKKKYVWFMVFAILAAISKEQIWVIIALFGGLIFIKHRKWLFGSAIFLSSLAMFYYLVSVAIPGAHGGDHFALSYFSEFGDSPLSIIKTIILSPDKIITLVLEKDRFNYIIQLFRPLGYLSFLAPWYLIFAGPDLLINILSNNAQLHQIYYQYTAAITPFIVISAIYGVKNIYRFLPKKFYSIAIIYVLAASLVGAYRYGPFPGSKDPNTDMFTKPVKNKEFIDNQLSKIPINLSVAASNNVGSHLSERENIYILPLGINKADILVFLLNNSEQPDSLKIEREQLKQLKNNKNYVIVAEKGDFIIIKKKSVKL